MPIQNFSELEVQSVIIENFRCIKFAKVDINSKITVLIGKNGSGKTSILDAIAIALQRFQNAWEYSNKTRQISRSERIDSGDITSNQDFSLIDLIMKSPTNNIFGEITTRIRCHSNKVIANDNFASLVNEINGYNGKFHKPLFIYYSQSRSFESFKSSKTSALSEDSLDGNLRVISSLEEWWDQRDAQEARTVRDNGHHDFRDPQLEAIRNLVRRIEGFKEIFYSASLRPQGLYFRKNNGSSVHVSKLSSGERSYIILLADLARRLQLSAPEKDLSSIPGIVLIDEIELNLHPAWQSEIIQTIQEVFSSCQFIITTHSPQVISAIESLNVRNVRRSDNGDITLDTPKSTRGRSSNYLLEGVFEAKERLPEVDKLIYDFNNSIERADLDKAESLFAKIQNIIEGMPSDLLILKKRIRELREQK
ncbi:AAA family ATPase [Brucella gallinifaecis]|nr:AAA family ATPase [Brucella gallinifaecis]